MRIILAMTVLLLAAGCDPGWTYHVQNPRMARTHTASGLSDSENLSLLLLDAHLFAMGLHIRTTVVNASGQLVPLDSASVKVFDRSGQMLTVNRVAGCDVGAPMSRLQSCSPEAYVSVTPLTVLFRPNPALQRLTVRVEGVTRSGRHVTICLPLEWDL
jgi:hypothetical protein